MWLVLLSLSIASEAYDQGFEEGVRTAKVDAKPGQAIWLGAAGGATGGLACCFAGPCGAPIGLAATGVVPTVYGVKDPGPVPVAGHEDDDYNQGFVDGYRKARRRQRIIHSSIAGVASAALVGGGVTAAGFALGVFGF